MHIRSPAGTVPALQITSRLSDVLSKFLDLTASRLKLTAANMANQNTPGYTREVAIFTNDVVSVNGSELGVQVQTVSQRDRVLEQRLQQQTQASSATDARSTALQSLEGGFGISSTSADASTTVLGSALNGFFTSLTSLSADPTSTTARGAVLAAAATLASAFNGAAAQVSSEASTLNSQIATAAQQINGLTAEVASLNKQITAQSPNADAGALEDQRQEAIQQLSALIGVNQVTTESNGVTLTASDGTVLVSGDTTTPVTTTVVGGNTHLAVGSPPSTVTGWTGGSIGGMIQARDTDLPGFASQLDQLAYAVGTAVNTQNAAGFTTAGVSGGNVFSVPSSASGAAAGISVTLTSGAGIATAGAGEGSAGTTNALALANLGTANLVGGESASNYFSDFIGQLGNTVSSAANAATVADAATTQAQTQRDSLSAVSLDEEASSLTQYQRSYEAAAKVFSVVNDLMAASINLGTDTPVTD